MSETVTIVAIEGRVTAIWSAARAECECPDLCPIDHDND